MTLAFHDTDADELRRIYAALSNGRITDDQAQAAHEAIHARRAAPDRSAASPRSRPATGRRRASGRREKMFGLGRPRPMDRNMKARIMHLARALSRRTEKGRAYGAVTAKALAVLQALLWDFHNAKSGVCFPSYGQIAEAAHCAVSTVGEAIKALEAVGLLSWVNRLKRIRERAPGLPGVGATRVRVIRTSNAYEFRDPSAPAARPNSSKTDFPSGTMNQGLVHLLEPSAPPKKRLGERLAMLASGGSMAGVDGAAC